MGTPSPNSESTGQKPTPKNYYPPYHEHYYNYPHSTPGYPIPKYLDYDPTYPPVIPTGPLPYPQPYPPPDFYYNHPHYHQQPPPPPLLLPDPAGPAAASRAFNRLMLFSMLVLISSMCMMILVVWFLYGVYVPEFEVSSLRVSNFTAVPGSGLTANWDASLIITNENRDVAIGFQNVRSLILYRGYILGFSSMNAFGVEKEGKVELGFRIAAAAADGGGVILDMDNVMIPALAGDWERGAAVFSLRLALTANFSSGTREYKKESLTVSCDGLRVETVAPESGEGMLNRGGGTQCLISL